MRVVGSWRGLRQDIRREAGVKEVPGRGWVEGGGRAGDKEKASEETIDGRHPLIIKPMVSAYRSRLPQRWRTQSRKASFL